MELCCKPLTWGANGPGSTGKPRIRFGPAAVAPVRVFGAKDGEEGARPRATYAAASGSGRAFGPLPLWVHLHLFLHVDVA